jgi:poly(hydroxyalkanoate) depolymerase family esterase
MNSAFQSLMREATRLTKTGQLAEATAAIQLALRGEAAQENVRDNNEAATGNRIFEGDFRVVEPEIRVSGAPPDIEPAVQAKQSARTAPPGYVEQSAQTEPPIYARQSAETELEGQFLSGSYRNHAGTRSYKLYVPSGQRDHASALIVMLHGCTQDPDDFAVGTRMNELAETHKCLVLYPAQAQTANGSKCWNWFKSTDQNRGRGEPAIIAGMTREIAAAYHVDSQRICIAGLSAGGAMAVVMAMSYPDLYAAVGVHSGLPYAIARDVPTAFAAMKAGRKGAQASTPEHDSRVVPAIVFHGDRDHTVHPRNGEQVTTQWVQTATAGTLEPPKVSVQRGQVPSGRAYTRSIYADESGQSLAEYWLIHGAGHAWSGGSNSGTYTDPKGPDASSEMLRFFFEHPMRLRH